MDTTATAVTTDGVTDGLKVSNGEIPVPDYTGARRQLIAYLGRDHFIDLTKPSRTLDIWWTVWPPLSVIFVAFLIGIIDNWWVRVVLIAFNGFQITNCAIVAHSLFSHRKVFKGGWVHVWGTVLATFSMISHSIYTASHHHHHRVTNTPADQDWEQADLDMRWKRWVYLTFPGYVAASMRLFAPKSSKHLAWASRPYFRKQLMKNPATRRLVVLEAIYVAAFWVIIIAGCLWKPEFFFLGYVVPLLTTTTLANGLREATEHQGVDLSNPMSVSPTSHLGWLRRTWMHQASSVHWVHHMWPNVPHYRAPGLWAELAPYVESQGVQAGTVWAEYYDFFVRGEAKYHWVDDVGTTNPAPSLTAFGTPEYAAAHR